MFDEWAWSLDLKLSIEKCATLHFGHGNPLQIYHVIGAALPNHKVVKDLGVLTSSSLKYSEHATEIALRASRLANRIARSFILKKPYVKLFDIYVLGCTISSFAFLASLLLLENGHFLALSSNFAVHQLYRVDF